ncbi:unnamed protein product [Bursaphelenchus okinawaensis]|uniref:Uncharacterized protein n=1 Tax=Bursaphelenchus okinawaensis TaxID=465554 RepID=A0A811LHC2_9BILA|nr:unnamed protein product [Bursaphelenchus okinawaensis]CAG9123406.1 unnamed protein product [Bursaphelenchus okinawaensis]
MRLLGKASGVVVQELNDPYDHSEELQLLRTAAFAAAIHGQIRPSDDPYLTNLDDTVRQDAYRVNVLSKAMKSHRLYYLHLAQTLTHLKDYGIELDFEELPKREKLLYNLDTTGHIFRYCNVFGIENLKPQCR